MAPPTVTAIIARKTMSAMGCRPLLGVYLDLESEALGLRRDCELVGGILEARLVVRRKLEVVGHEKRVKRTSVHAQTAKNAIMDADICSNIAIVSFYFQILHEKVLHVLGFNFDYGRYNHSILQVNVTVGHLAVFCDDAEELTHRLDIRRMDCDGETELSVLLFVGVHGGDYSEATEHVLHF